MEDKKISEEMLELNEKFDASMGKMIGGLLSDTSLSDMEINPMMAPALETYKITFDYMNLFTKFLAKQEALMAKMDKALDIYIQKNGE